MWQHFEIAGTGLYFPHQRLSAEDVDRRAGLPSGWTRAHAGVLLRHECAPPESVGSMAEQAIESALYDAAVAWPELDLFIDASTCRHQPIPCNAACVLQRFGAQAQGIPAMDVQSTCLGFPIAVHVANALFATGAYRHILIVCSEAALLGVDWREPESACLMGDGAAAAVLRRREPMPTYAFAHETYAEHADVCRIRGGGHVLPPTAYSPQTDAEFRFHMDGPLLMRLAGKYLPPLLDRLLRQAEVGRDVLQVIPHQAAPRALALMRRMLGFHPECYHNRVAQFGNLIAAGIPTVLHLCRHERLLAPGDRVLLLGTSAGYSQAGLVFQV
jgi:3-oxoacyl-[acyl-carrier-protein] synthase-3